jgi:UDP:flavonoid glycosyltransferase YjiC (YdhE family)
MKILAIPMNAGGDLHPLVATAVGLLERGHEVVVYGEHSAIKMLAGVNAPMITAPREIDFSPLLLETLKKERVTGDELPSHVLRQTLEQYSDKQAHAIGESMPDGFRPDVVMSSLVGARVVTRVAAELGAASCVVNSDFYIGPDPPRPLAVDFDARSTPEVEYLGEEMQRADLVLHAVDQHFDFDFDRLPERNYYVGPLIWEKPTPAPGYLKEKGDPWALVAISTQKQGDVMIARLANEALENQPVRIVDTIGGEHRTKELGHLPPNIHVEHYVPHSAVLEEARVLVSHAGIGSVTKALWYGVPLVLVPWGRDQPGVAARAEALGVARVVDREALTKEAIDTALHAVLDDPGHADAAQQVSARWREMDPVGEACRRVERLLTKR